MISDVTATCLIFCHIWIAPLALGALGRSIFGKLGIICIFVVFQILFIMVYFTSCAFLVYFNSYAFLVDFKSYAFWCIKSHESFFKSARVCWFEEKYKVLWNSSNPPSLFNLFFSQNSVFFFLQTIALRNGLFLNHSLCIFGRFHIVCTLNLI